jgi:hypothetical protein
MEGNNRLIIAVGVLGVLAGGVWYVNREKPEERQERVSDPWTAIVRDQVTRLSIDPAGDAPAIELEKRDNKWFMNNPGRGPADESQITSMLSSLADMHVASVASQESGSHAMMEVDSAHAVRLQVYRGSAKLFDGWVGKDLDGGTAVRFEGNSRVFRVTGLERFRLQNAPREWRNRQITNLERSHVRWVQWQDATGTFRFDRNNDTWTGAASNPAIERLDTARVNQLVTNLIALNATDFAADNASTGITAQSARFTIDVDNGPQVVLSVGSNSGDDGIFVKRGDSDIVFVASRATAGAIDFDPTAVQTPLPPEGGVGDASAAPEPAAPPGGMPMGMPMGMPGGPGGPGGSPQISPEIMRQIQQQLARQAGAQGGAR